MKCQEGMCEQLQDLCMRSRLHDLFSDQTSWACSSRSALRQLPMRTRPPHTYLLTIGEISDRPSEAARTAGSSRSTVPNFIVEPTRSS